ncbi:unnamed protein product [Ceratitis capitata]|uniref:(Mediterranean fruit fly) hypothetical protein n=1 Tax=Ceratitis capitata TaxID=7213 RepID=A0A811UDY6_CERCA|nr:unnamed protein product [Ceratitis capitata]
MMHTSLTYFFTVMCITFVFTVECLPEYSQDTYLNALQSSHKPSYDDSLGYNYIPPSSNNLQPQNSLYGPPNQAYGPPTLHIPLPTYHPRYHWFLEKLKKKINLFTIGKIILKLLIFKKIIKFIGVICLLLFLPKLKDLLKEDMSMEESSAESKTTWSEKEALKKHIEELLHIIPSSIASLK